MKKVKKTGTAGNLRKGRLLPFPCSCIECVKVHLGKGVLYVS